MPETAEHQALGAELPKDAPAARANGQANTHLVLPSHSSGEHESADICTRHQEDEQAEHSDHDAHLIHLRLHHL